MPEPAPTVEGYWCRRSDVLHRETATTLLLSRRAGQVLALSGAGLDIWELLRRPRSVPDMIDDLVKRYDVDPDAIADDVHRTVQELIARQLVHHSADVTALPTASAGQPA